MNFYDNERNIIEDFQLVECSSVCFLTEKDELISIFDSIHHEEEWKLWIDSSRKADLPPDFYNNELELMMDVMRVDDHAHKNKKGKIVNPTNAKESEMQWSLRQSGFLEHFPNAQHIICNAITDLPTEQDHNYKYYLTNFIRTVEEHKRKIELYKQNHPNYKIIFFIFDESSAYFEAENKTDEIFEGMPIIGSPHLWFLDKAFTDVFVGSAIDYVIWFTPFKHIELFCSLVLPEVAVFDTKETTEVRTYKLDKMVSCEV